MEDDARRFRPPQKAADILAQLMARRGYARVQAAAVAEEAWAKAVGERLAAHSHAGPIKRGVLEVLVANSAVMQELTFEKKRVLKKLAAELPDEKINDVKFRVGTWE